MANMRIAILMLAALPVLAGQPDCRWSIKRMRWEPVAAKTCTDQAGFLMELGVRSGDWRFTDQTHTLCMYGSTMKSCEAPPEKPSYVEIKLKSGKVYRFRFEESADDVEEITIK